MYSCEERLLCGLLTWGAVSLITDAGKSSVTIINTAVISPSVQLGFYMSVYVLSEFKNGNRLRVFREPQVSPSCLRDVTAEVREILLM